MLRRRASDVIGGSRDALAGFALMAACWALVLLAVWLVLGPRPAQARVPAAAEMHRAEMTRSAYRVHGPGAPVAMLAAQIHQESAWRTDARSRVGALGLAQFMPATAADMARLHPTDCAPADPFNPRWAFACRDRYMSSLARAQRPLATGIDACSRWVFALRSYNGGLGWLNWDRAAAQRAGANPDQWAQVQPHRGTNPRTGGRRSDANHHENTDYAVRILRLQSIYRSWGPGVCA
jgi:soluble lytic murein transglycosylase-like protein